MSLNLSFIPLYVLYKHLLDQVHHPAHMPLLVILHIALISVVVLVFLVIWTDFFSLHIYPGHLEQ